MTLDLDRKDPDVHGNDRHRHHVLRLRGLAVGPGDALGRARGAAGRVPLLPQSVSPGPPAPPAGIASDSSSNFAYQRFAVPVRVLIGPLLRAPETGCPMSTVEVLAPVRLETRFVPPGLRDDGVNAVDAEAPRLPGRVLDSVVASRRRRRRSSIG